MPLKKIASGIAIASLTLFLPLTAFAATQGNWTIDGSGNITSMGIISGVEGTFQGYTYLMNTLAYTQGPSIPQSAICPGGSGGSGPFTASGFIGTNVFSNGGLNSHGSPYADCRTAGNYYLVSYNDFSTHAPTGFYELHYDGTHAVAIPPGGSLDGNPNTHVISIDAPALYSIASSTFPVFFTILGASSSPPIGYDLTFVNQLSRATYTRSGWLSDTGFSSANYGTAFQVGTSTSLPADGTYQMTVSLWSGGLGGPGPDPAGTVYQYFSPTQSSVFSVNVQDNVQTVIFTGPAQQTFASTSCNVNFLGTFSFQDCLGYLLTPSTASGSPLSNLKSLTLAHSAPFAYAYQIGDIRNALFDATNTASTTIGVQVPWLNHSTTTITFLSAAMINNVPYTPWIKNILAALMLFMTAEVVYYAVIRSHNSQTGV